MRQIALILIYSSMQVLTISCSTPPSGDLKFSNTQTWIPAWKELGEKRIHASRKNPLIELPPPPQPSVTKKEVELLLYFQTHTRTSEILQQIMLDREISGWTLGEIHFNDHMSSATPLGRSLLKLFNTSLPEILAAKMRFNRANVFAQDRRIMPVLETPGHPAYPSCHGASAFFLAYVLSEVAPEQKDFFLCDAARIAVEQEIGGLQFPSDSEAGQMLAQLFFEKWKAIPENQNGLRELKKWWSENRSAFLAEREYRKPRLIGPRICTLEEARNFFREYQGTSENNLKTK